MEKIQLKLEIAILSLERYMETNPPSFCHVAVFLRKFLLHESIGELTSRAIGRKGRAKKNNDFLMEKRKEGSFRIFLSIKYCTIRLCLTFDLWDFP